MLNWLFDLAEDRTLVVLIDDLSRLDEDSAALLNKLSQAAPKHRILLIAARRLAEQLAMQRQQAQVDLAGALHGSVVGVFKPAVRIIDGDAKPHCELIQNAFALSRPYSY